MSKVTGLRQSECAHIFMVIFACACEANVFDTLPIYAPFEVAFEVAWGSASVFDQPLSGWDVSKVTDMYKSECPHHFVRSLVPSADLFFFPPMFFLLQPFYTQPPSISHSQSGT